MPPSLFLGELWVALSFSEEGGGEPGGGPADNTHQSGRVKSEAFYLSTIMHIVRQSHSCMEGLNVSGVSSKVTCLDLGCHFCCS